MPCRRARDARRGGGDARRTGSRRRRSGSRSPRSSTRCSPAGRPPSRTGPRLPKNDGDELLEAVPCRPHHHRGATARPSSPSSTASHREARGRKQALVERAEALAAGARRQSPTTAACSTTGRPPAAPARRSMTPSGPASRPPATCSTRPRRRSTPSRTTSSPANLEQKLALLDEAEQLLKATDRDAAQATCSASSARWDAVGKVPRDQVRVDRGPPAQDRGRRSQARRRPLEPDQPGEAGSFGGLRRRSCRARSPEAEDELAGATKAGDKAKIAKAEEALAAHARLARRARLSSPQSSTEFCTDRPMLRHPSRASRMLTGCSPSSTCPIERRAMRLDGELYQLADGYVSIAVPDVPASRAAATARARAASADRGASAPPRGSWGRPHAPPRRPWRVHRRPRSAMAAPQPVDGSTWSRPSSTPETSRASAASSSPRPCAPRSIWPDSASDVRSCGRSCGALARVGRFGFSAREALTTMDRGRNLAGKQLAARASRSRAGAISPS